MSREIPQQNYITPTSQLIEVGGRHTELVDISGREPWEVRQAIAHLIGVAERIVITPDLSPTAKGLIPTGCAAQFDIESTPDFLKYVAGADMGCGYAWGLFDSITLEEWENEPSKQDLVDAVDRRLTQSWSMANGLGVSLGGGNHFLELFRLEGSLGVIVHTGAPVRMQQALTEAVGDPQRYLKLYRDIQVAAAANRRRIIELVEVAMGISLVSKTFTDIVHNSIHWSDGPEATVYKGTVNTTAPENRGATLVIPSAMGGEILFARAGDGASSATLGALPHGTGREVSRGEMKYLAEMKEASRPDGVLLPTNTTINPTQHPIAYRDMMKTIEILTRYGSIQPDYMLGKSIVHFPSRNW